MRSRRQRTSHVVDTFVWSSRRYCAPFYALFAPKGTPKAIVDKLAEALNKGAQRGDRAEAPGRFRGRDRGAGVSGIKGSGGSAEERGKPAGADPEGRGRQVGWTGAVTWPAASARQRSGRGPRQARRRGRSHSESAGCPRCER